MKGMWYMQFGKYSRVDKRVARKIYNEGKDVLFIPRNMRPDNNWGLGIVENKYLFGQEATFDKLVDTYTWYNCNNETGRYVAFYKIKEE